MYTITFYSYKGGVGRSMALVNCACELAQRGKKVLIIDFDLEAPGITTFAELSVAEGSAGLVDFVSDYIRSGKSPSVAEYVHLCKHEKIPLNSIWVMPSGSQTAAYANKFASIDWRSLYEHNDGYLLIEDMKAQLKSNFEFDYVLVDSRTGYTDVGGICTRQIPDAVAIFFFPNDQNLYGLKNIVEKISHENKVNKVNKDKLIDTYFVASNVPDLDDEDDITGSQLKKFREALRFNDVSARIHHYQNLQLLDQVVFTLDRKKSSLAVEYRNLVDVITAKNLEDVQIALRTLGEIQAIVGRPSRSLERSLLSIEDDLRKIANSHSQNGEVQFRMGTVRERMGALEDAQELYSRSIALGFKNVSVFMSRANLARKSQNASNAISDIKSALSYVDITLRDAVFAVRWLVEIDPAQYLAVPEMPGLEKFGPQELSLIAAELMVSKVTIASALNVLNRAEKFSSDQVAEAGITNKRVLCLISMGAYEEAQREIFPDGRADKFQIYDAFNFAIANWGLKEQPDPEQFREILGLASDSPRVRDANFLQCMALSKLVCGELKEAIVLIGQAEKIVEHNPTKTFSCWTYLEATVSSFRRDLDEMRQWATSGVPVRPPVTIRPRSPQRL